MTPYRIIVWDNAGVRSARDAARTEDARQYRTPSNRTVKVADAFGTVAHWSRTGRNHWSRRAVAGPCSP